MIDAKKVWLSYIHFISGQDLPLMSHAQMDAYIESKGIDKQFVEETVIDTAIKSTTILYLEENPNNRKKLYRLTDIVLRCIQVASFYLKKKF